MPRTFSMTDAHIAAFSEQQRQRFEDEMVAFFRKQYPTEFAKMGEAWIRELIRKGIDTASEYGIKLEPDVARYIELMLTVSPHFDESEKTPWARPILTNNRLTGNEKILALYEHLMFGGSQKPAGGQP